MELKSRYENFIGGHWVAPVQGRYSENATPATGEPFTEVPRSTPEDVELARVPVLMLTAAGDDDTTWAGWSSGASTYLNKPFDHDQLLSWVERLLTPPDTTIVSEKPAYQLATTV